jgi:DNA-binding NarL/FixJ family response regulator
MVCGGAGVVLITGPVRLSLGKAAAILGRLDDAVQHLRASIAMSERIGMPPSVASGTYELAKVLSRRNRPGDRAEASALAVSAAALADRLGMRPLRDRARDLAASLDGHGPGPLTRREREIAGLVAQGLTNRQIAAMAHISERTAETHIQHILDKLGFASRTQIAAWVAAEKPTYRR